MKSVKTEPPGRKTVQELIGKALCAASLAYAPYSRFQVGAALLCADGSVCTGCNVENASYPAGLCAERAAVAKAVSGGKREFAAIAIVGGRDGKVTDFCPPCGICRQVLREFADPKRFYVILAASADRYRLFTLEELLPESFGPEKL